MQLTSELEKELERITVEVVAAGGEVSEKTNTAIHLFSEKLIAWLDDYSFYNEIVLTGPVATHENVTEMVKEEAMKRIKKSTELLSKTRGG